MQFPAPSKSPTLRTERIFYFASKRLSRCPGSVQEVRSVDSLTGSAAEINAPSLKKVRHIVRRSDKSLFVVNGALHFGLPVTAGLLVLVLRRTRTALLIDGIEKMSTMTILQALPQAFCNEERTWYRGLTALDQNVVPVVNPEGATSEEKCTRAIPEPRCPA
jgi:hypothetical protein